MRSIDRNFDPIVYLKVAERLRELDKRSEEASSQLRETNEEAKRAQGLTLEKKQYLENRLVELRKQSDELNSERWSLVSSTL
jgi:hypothetical protein